MYLANTLVNVDSACRSALALDKMTVSLNATGSPGTGVANYTALSSLMGSLTSGDVVRLPEGTVLVDLNADSNSIITFKAGVRFIGHEKGTTIKVTNQLGSHNPLRPASNTTFENITFQWDMASHPSAGSDCSLVYVNGVDNVTFRKCKFFGDADTAVTAVGGQLYWLGRVICLDVRNSTNITADECEVARSTGSNYGLQIYGGSDQVYRDCYFHHCAADGVKILGNSANGQPSSIRFVNCRSNYNGQVIIQGQTVYTNTYTSNTTITPVNGARYLVNGTFTLTLNNGTNGDSILISKLIGSGTCTVSYTGGPTIMNSSYDRWTAQFTYSAGAWGLTNATYTNGEGWDVTGSDLVFDNCLADGNEGSGFQVKPTLIDTVGKNVASGVRFRGCSSKNSWGANGFGFVNNISSGEISMQDVSLTDCVAEGNRANGYITTSGSLPIYGLTMTNCSARNNGGDGLSLAALTRMFVASNCKFLGNGNLGSGWNAKVYAVKGARFTDCYFSGVDPYSQSLYTVGDNSSTDVDKAANARCYGVYIDKSSGGTMSDVVFDNCRWHNHLATNGASTSIRLYDSGVNPITTAYAQAISVVMGQNRISFGNVMAGVITINSQQTATLTHSSNTAWSGATAYVVGDVVASGGNLYRCILNHTNQVPPNATYWVQVGSDIITLA